MSSLITFGALPIGYPPTQPPQTSALIRRALIATLKADPGVSALVGARVYPLYVPQSEGLGLALTVQVLGVTRPTTLAGASGLAVASVQFTAHSRNLIENEGLVEAVRQAVQGLRGTTFTAETGDLTFLNVNPAGERDLLDRGHDGKDAPTFLTSVDYSLRYTEPKPRGL